jgi:hypothetical protein
MDSKDKEEIFLLMLLRSSRKGMLGKRQGKENKGIQDIIKRILV